MKVKVITAPAAVAFVIATLILPQGEFPRIAQGSQ
jgi:hypothetical protein